jgi:8-oxo-dGTP diphosphatase
MNSKLYGNDYKIPDKILNYINKQVLVHSDHDGVKRGKNLLKTKSITYSGLKRLKNFYDEYEKNKEDEIKYNLSGGDLMKDFVEQTLKKERKGVEIYDKTTKDFKNNLSLTNKNNHKLTESINDLNLNVVCVIFNNENRVLLLKRSSYEDQWEPNKWSLPGGIINKNEKIIDALNREIKEETNIEINKYIASFSIIRNNNVEYVYVCKYEGSDEDITLDEENSGYGWFSEPEIKFLNTVPNLMEYISIAITKY